MAVVRAPPASSGARRSRRATLGGAAKANQRCCPVAFEVVRTSYMSFVARKSLTDPLRSRERGRRGPLFRAHVRGLATTING